MRRHPVSKPNECLQRMMVSIHALVLQGPARPEVPLPEARRGEAGGESPFSFLPPSFPPLARKRRPDALLTPTCRAPNQK